LSLYRASACVYRPCWCFVARKMLLSSDTILHLKTIMIEIMIMIIIMIVIVTVIVIKIIKMIVIVIVIMIIIIIIRVGSCVHLPRPMRV